MNPHLQHERQQIKFNQNELTLHIFGTREKIDTFKKISEIAAKDPILKNDPNFFNLGREEQIAISIKKFNRYYELFDLNDSYVSFMQSMISNAPATLSLHQLMFIPSLKALGDENQVKKWLPLAESYKILGCYAQTEIGHGSDIQSLELEAVFDKTKDEFVLHSPTLTSIKFWPGDLGIMCNVALVNAILIIDGKKYGMQSFIVPIRDLKTHEPFPGVEVGDIGPKLAYQTKDNGFLKFTNYRIPRENLLMRYVKVSKSGEFSQIGNPRVLYNAMMKTRVFFCEIIPFALAQPTIIATRFSIVRQQFRDEFNNERSIIEYQLQQSKIFGMLSDLYTLVALGQKVSKLYDDNCRRVDRGDFSGLNEIHIISSGAKALITYLAQVGLSTGRLACGGLGYSDYSGIPGTLKNETANITVEGENTILYLQVARFLLKQLENSKKGKEIPHFVDYIKIANEVINEKCTVDNEKQFLALETIRKTLIANASYWILESARIIMDDISQGKPATGRSGIAMVNAGYAHNIYYAFNIFMDSLRKYHDEPLREVQTKLCLLFGLRHIEDRPLGLIESGYLSGEQLKWVSECKESLLPEIRKNAIGLVDAFHFDDNILKSALGRFDGNIYEEIYRLAHEGNTLTKDSIGKGMDYIKSMQKTKPKI